MDRKQIADWSSVATVLRKRQGVGLWRYDLQSRQATWSDEALQLLGLTGNSAPDFALPGAERTRDARATLEKAFRRNLEQGDTFEFIHRSHRPGGQEKCLKAFGALVEIEGQAQLIGSLKDVTEERHAFETVALQAEELRGARDHLDAENTRFKDLFDQAPVFVALGSTPDLRFEYANRAYRTLVGDRRLVGKTVSEALPEVVAQGLVALLTQVYETGEPYMAAEAPTDLYDERDGTWRTRYLTYMYQPIRGSGDQITGVLCVGYDVTEQYLAKEEAERLQTELIRSSHLSAMGTMASTLAHELNQPLTSLVLFSAGLARRLGETPDRQALEAIDAVQSEALRASEILRRMRAVASGHAIKRRPIELCEVIAKAMKAALAACEGVEVTMDLRHTGLVWGDELQVQLVIGNILRNACEAMSGHGAKNICIVTEDQADEVMVRITDTGPGIAPDMMPRMFVATQSTKEEGMGIGLAICRTIVDAHGGRIGVHGGGSGDGGGGASFWFTLPRRTA